MTLDQRSQMEKKMVYNMSWKLSTLEIPDRCHISAAMFYILVMVLLTFLLMHHLDASNDDNDFIFNGFRELGGTAWELGGTADVGPNGILRLSSATSRLGHFFYSRPLQFKNSSNGRVFSFSTTFVFAILPEYPKSGGHGIAFVISPSKEFPEALPGPYLGLFNVANNNSSSNHIVAVELDTQETFQFKDINGSHIGIDINGIISIDSKTAGYYTDENGGFQQLDLKSGNSMQIWVEYNGVEKQLDVTLSPIDVPKPKKPLLSLKLDLSPIILDTMFVGFSSSTGELASSHYILGWSFKMNGQAQPLDPSRLPQLPQNGHKEKRNQKFLAIGLTIIAVVFLLAMFLGIALTVRRRIKFEEVIEDWELQYGPHRFTYKDLFIATKGFKDKELLGRGGFGRVYRGVLPKSKIQVAVKRVSHDSRQGIRQFVAEIATIGRLRHPNLVRLLGYCRRKGELFLVYDFMPNASLDKFLFDQSKPTLNWTHRYKIIKDVSSGLFYLHQQWVQVVVHRDIKASNVLLDGELNGRIGDFGLAKLCDRGTDPQTTHLVGTLGYIAPELARTGKASTSTDLFAFGAFLLEMACGRRPVEPRASPDEILLVDWVSECWKRGAILETVDPRLGSEYVAEEMELVLKLGLICSHPVATARPSMSRVVQYLQSDAALPDDWDANFLSLEHHDGLNGHLMEYSSTPSLIITESFRSIGR